MTKPFADRYSVSPEEGEASLYFIFDRVLQTLVRVKGNNGRLRSFRRRKDALKAVEHLNREA